MHVPSEAGLVRIEHYVVQNPNYRRSLSLVPYLFTITVEQLSDRHKPAPVMLNLIGLR